MTVTVAPDLFDRQAAEICPDGEGWMGSPAFLVVADDVPAAAAALYAAGELFMLLDEKGEEHEEWELVEYWGPSYVSPVQLTAAGPMMWTDTKGELSAAMGTGMIRILVAELTARGVTAHVTAPSEDDLGADLPEWEPPPVPEPPRGPVAPRVWFIARSVRLTTTTGRRYGDWEYRTADGAWVGERTTAERFAEAPVDLVVTLRTDPVPPERGEVNGILLPDDDSPTGPLPPVHLRRPR
jgi:hypothetical protein